MFPILRRDLSPLAKLCSSAFSRSSFAHRPKRVRNDAHGSVSNSRRHGAIRKFGAYTEGVMARWVPAGPSSNGRSTVCDDLLLCRNWQLMRASKGAHLDLAGVRASRRDDYLR
jgi:hypothetical protein